MDAHGDPVIAGMATFPPRYEFAWQAISSIAVQVDKLHLLINDAGQAPRWLSHLPENVQATTATGIDAGDLADAGKFWGAQQYENAFYLSCDDDIIYPPGYAAQLTRKIIEHGPRVACSYHGCRVPDKDVRSYYSSQVHKVHWRKRASQDMPMHVLGTGVMGVHLGHVDIPMDVFGNSPVADLYVSRYLDEQGIKRVALAHPEKWLKKIEAAGRGPEIHNVEPLDYAQAKIVNKHNWSLIRD